jgi:hypothetical protein
MRRLFLIIQVIIFFVVRSFSQATISVSCDDSWGPGRYNRVTIKIRFDNKDGFARFTQEYPVGFEIFGADTKNTDFTVNGQRLSAVWMKIPGNGQAEFSYLVLPDKTINGTIDLEGKLVIISGGTKRTEVNLTARTITVGGVNGTLPEKKGTRPQTGNVTNVTNPNVPDGAIEFRIQVKTSSSKIPEDQLRKDMGLGSTEKISIVQSGKVYKYQVGRYSDYQEASQSLKRLKDKGLKDSFIVAYRGDEQIPVDKARNGSI